MEVVRRIVYLVFRPKAEWALIATEPTTIDMLLRRYIVPLCALAPIATFIGMRVFDVSWDAEQGYTVPADQHRMLGAKRCTNRGKRFVEPLVQCRRRVEHRRIRKSEGVAHGTRLLNVRRTLNPTHKARRCGASDTDARRRSTTRKRLVSSWPFRRPSTGRP